MVGAEVVAVIGAAVDVATVAACCSAALSWRSDACGIGGDGGSSVGLPRGLI